MTTRLTGFFVGVVGLFAFAVGTMQGCGGSSGSSNADLCKKICEKNTMCTPDAGTADTMSCETTCNSQSANVHCSNQAAIASAINTCVGMSDCAAALDCLNNGSVPDCQTTTGTGGSGGSNGGGGAGGSSGSAWTCTDDTTQMACGCVMSAGGGSLTSCPTTYNCCISIPAQGGNPASCLCSTAATAADCTTAAGVLGGTKVTRCPP
jgi:hypothetical protein